MKFNLEKMNVYAYQYAQTKQEAKNADKWEDLLDVLVDIGFEQGLLLRAKGDAQGRGDEETAKYLMKAYDKYYGLAFDVKEKIKDMAEREMNY